MNKDRYTYKKIMAEEIEQRLRSDVWNLQIASGVLAKKTRTRKRVLFASSWIASAAAAVVLFVFFFGIDTGRPAAGYDQFIAYQIEGTMKDAAGKKEKLSVAPTTIHEVVLHNETDTMIDETLAMR